MRKRLLATVAATAIMAYAGPGIAGMDEANPVFFINRGNVAY